MKVKLLIETRLILFIIFGSFFQYSISEHVCDMEKYITKSYFEKYEKLIDSRFNNFIENEITIDQETMHTPPTLSTLHREVVGEGSHRRLYSSIKFKKLTISQSESMPSCVLVFIERLPLGVFADPFELQHLVQRGVFTDAAVFGDTNLELPSFQSNRSLVEIHLSMPFKVSTTNHEDLEVNFEIPLHARYQPLGHGFSRVEFGHPDLFMCCGIDGNEPSKSCLVIPANTTLDSGVSPLAWDIPCGIRKHGKVVSVITFISAALAALIIVFASIKSSNS